jgi:ParB family chromosome partitioning protein
MVDSNVQRENILPSEKAFAYKMKLEAVKKQGSRSDLSSRQVGTRFRSDSLLAENSKESARTIQRFICLTELIPQLLQMVDERKIAFNPAVELSYLPKEEQTLLLSAMEAEQSTPSLSQAQRLKSLSAEGKFTEDSAINVMREQKSNQQEQIKIPYDKIKAIVKKDMMPKALEEFILTAVADYQKRLKARENRDAR